MRSSVLSSKTTKTDNYFFKKPQPLEVSGSCFKDMMQMNFLELLTQENQMYLSGERVSAHEIYELPQSLSTQFVVKEALVWVRVTKKLGSLLPQLQPKATTSLQEGQAMSISHPS